MSFASKLVAGFTATDSTELEIVLVSCPVENGPLLEHR